MADNPPSSDSIGHGPPPLPPPPLPLPAPPPNPTKFQSPINWRSSDLTRFTGPIIEIPPGGYLTYPDRCPLPTHPEGAAITKPLENAGTFTRASRLVGVKRSPSSPNRPRSIWPTLDPSAPENARSTVIPGDPSHGDYIASSGQMKYLNPRPSPHIPTRVPVPRRHTSQAPIPRRPISQSPISKALVSKAPALQAPAPQVPTRASLAARYSTRPERPAPNYYWNIEKQEWCIHRFIEHAEDTPKDTEKNLKRERFRSAIKSVIDRLRGGNRTSKNDQARRDVLKAKISYPLGLKEKKREQKE